MIDEVKHALNKTKIGKTPLADGITSDMLSDAGDEVHNKLAQLFTQCLCKRDVPEAWCNAIVSLVHKKGDKEDLGNYLSMTLLLATYKLFAKILTNRLQKILDENQPREKARFKNWLFSYGPPAHNEPTNRENLRVQHVSLFSLCRLRKGL